MRPIIAIIAFALMTGCATTYTDGQLRAMDDPSLWSIATRKQAHAADPVADTAAKIVCERDGLSATQADFIVSGGIDRGMTKKQVWLAQGRPTNQNTTNTPNGAVEQWVYRHARRGGQLYVYFRDGFVTSWQTSDYVY